VTWWWYGIKEHPLLPHPQSLPQPKLEETPLDLVVEAVEEVEVVEKEAEAEAEAVEVEEPDSKLQQQPPPTDLLKGFYLKVMMEIAKA
jgi:hypothetical protein